MNWNEHIAFGLICAGAAFFYFRESFVNAHALLSFFGAAMLGSLFPDVDHQMGKLHNLVELGIGVLIIYIIIIQQYFVAIFAALALIALQLLKHRGITHNPIALTVISIAMLIFVSFFAGTGFLIGSLSHVASDWVSTWVKRTW